MFSISTEELEKLPDLGDTVDCPRCFRKHEVQHSVGDKGGTTLSFYKCRGTAYMAGIDGKDVTERYKK